MNHLLILTNIKYCTYANNQQVHESVDVRALELGLATVHHELGVAASEDDEAVAPLGVAQHAAAQQDLVVVDRVRAAPPRHLALEPVQAVVRRFTDDLSCGNKF